MSYEVAYRKRVIEYRKRGHTLEETGRAFHVSVPTIRNWERQLREKGHLEKKVFTRKFKKIDPEKLAWYIRTYPFAQQKEIAQVFNCSSTAVRQAFKRLGITYKKGGVICRARGQRRAEGSMIHN